VSKVRTFASACTEGGRPYGVVPSPIFSRTAFYIGEVVYRGVTHTGEHASFIDRTCFDAVQAKLAENVVSRRVRVKNSPPS
jgi:hypothetical protein